MRFSFGRVLRLSFVYIGVVIGAGFASGRELVSFFVDYGDKWAAGILVAGLLFGLLGYAVISVIYRYKIKSYSEFLDLIPFRIPAAIIDISSGLFLTAMFYIMLAAASSMSVEICSAPPAAGCVLLSLFCLAAMLWGIDGIAAVSSALSPVLIAGSILSGIYLLLTRGSLVSFFPAENSSSWLWLASAVIYASYNSVASVSVLIASHPLILCDKRSRYAGLISGASICLMGLCIGAALYFNYKSIRFSELPLLSLMQEGGSAMERLYILAAACAILTTAVSSAYGASLWFTERLGLKSSLPVKILLSVSGLLVFNIPFSVLISRLYPLFGIIGLIEAGFIIWLFLRSN